MAPLILCVPKTSSTSCDQAIFVDQATDASMSADAILLKIDRFGQRSQRRGTVQRAVRPMLVMVDLVFAQDPPRMVLVPDEGAVQELAAASPDPALGDRVHAGRPHVAQHGPDPGAGEDRVERGGEVRAAVADHELDPVCLSAEIHEQVAGLLGGPFPGRDLPSRERQTSPTHVQTAWPLTAHSPWERGTNENTNGLLREYFPKGTDITGDIRYLNTVADEINGRPRAILQFRTPAEVFAELLLADNPEDNLSSIASTG